MIPLMLMCAAPRAHPVFSSEVFPLGFALILGLSNGVLGSVPMIQAPGKVDDRHRELTGVHFLLMYTQRQPTIQWQYLRITPLFVAS